MGTKNTSAIRTSQPQTEETGALKLVSADQSRIFPLSERERQSQRSSLTARRLKLRERHRRLHQSFRHLRQSRVFEEHRLRPMLRFRRRHLHLFRHQRLHQFRIRKPTHRKTTTMDNLKATVRLVVPMTLRLALLGATKARTPAKHWSV
jgi:hypothetical protein